MEIKDTSNLALFLDFDGTLVDFAATPEGVVVSSELRDVLAQLALRLNGALALVSGRSIESLGGLINLPLSMAGSHGAEWRYGDGPVSNTELGNQSFREIRSLLLSFAEKNHLIAEDKGHAVALHYRKNPAKQPEIEAYIATQLALDDSDQVRVIRGNCVYEIQPVGVDKGVAIARFMSTPPFSGRQPVYIGDDTTDEDGFAWVNAQGGVSIKVGEGPSCANVRLSDTGEVLAFLQLQLDKLRQLDDRTKLGIGANR
ncbi:trehalose-phosphatase [uncultured Gilvimarinus sp.]|uniref:trehalose-phosphatase n=1 Tax=uncultured Gilvimarinus sp. TaxID=1689143 RepID=UPI0030EBBDE2|tara:strand:+ start:133 stop:903 length:771 start_codon:yes stop_codon:yes gene_type:complete